jgi:hypothetical protein
MSHHHMNGSNKNVTTTLNGGGSFGGTSLNSTTATVAANTNTNNTSSHTQQDTLLIPSQEEIPHNMSTNMLETRLRQLQEAAQEHSQILTQKLASSSSGQNLLHIGTSLSTLPPDLHTLLTHMHPFVSVLEDFEQSQRKALTQLVDKAMEIRQDQYRVYTAQRAADLYADLIAAETCVATTTTSTSTSMKSTTKNSPYHNNNGNDQDNESTGVETSSSTTTTVGKGN